MRTVFIHARYTDQTSLEDFLIRKFGLNSRTRIMWKRGKYQCDIPRLLTKNEIEELKQTVDFARYSEL
ncbi:hypothetical protein P154DRAFT_520134 [Amniculicola lignicola CBS 123094]|uniref:Uncharacterized protein n=1 Tax=Amniculicola lignicola CBS 123094 TaxID=1392246 RepID=A0A6A5WPC5_9PLEO|nr:hypothetical protein P154DRAFT_520134 [Amniculicola lignicola CBS 123094]